MQSASYYRQQAERARRLVSDIFVGEIIDNLNRIARDFDDLAADLEDGVIDVERPEPAPQQDHLGP